jgi:hypothetical protein
VVYYLRHRGLLPKRLVIEHQNRDKHDNQSANLRAVSQSTNKSNSGKRRDNKSGYKTVAFNEKKKRWAAQIKLNGRSIYLRQYPMTQLAARAVNDGYRKHRLGEPYPTLTWSHRPRSLLTPSPVPQSAPTLKRCPSPPMSICNSSAAGDERRLRRPASASAIINPPIRGCSKPLEAAVGPLLDTSHEVRIITTNAPRKPPASIQESLLAASTRVTRTIYARSAHLCLSLAPPVA